MKTSQREADAQRFVRQVSKQTGIVECLTCNTQHRVDLGEDGAGAIDQRPCHADNCTAMLCCACQAFECHDCGLLHCIGHALALDGVLYCPTCAKDVARCTECGSGDLAFNQYDHGKDPETGYHDAGETFTCRKCGATGDASDTKGRE